MAFRERRRNSEPPRNPTSPPPIKKQKHHILGHLGAPTAVPLVSAIQASARIGNEGRQGPAVRTSGVYCLVLWLPRACHITLSRLGACCFERGWYVYTGSAKRNLLHRLLRHLRRRKKLHWHIDHLRTVASVRQIWVWPWTAGRECRTNTMVRHMWDAACPVKGFGASDCRCFAHLVSFPSEPVPPDPGAPFTYRVRGGRIIADRMEEG